MLRRRSCVVAVALALGSIVAPVPAPAFDTVDALPFPSAGFFPAWPREPIPPWSIYAYGGLMHDTNALRLETGEQSDTVARIGAGGRATGLLVGRQRYLLEGFGEYYKFDRFNEIDHFGYGALASLLWELGNNVDGDARYARRRRHADLGEFRSDRRAMVTSERFLFEGGYAFHPDWRIAAAAEHTTEERDGADGAEIDANTARGSLTYRTPLGNALGVEVRGTRGDARFTDEAAGITLRDEYDEREVALTLAYALGAQLRVGARVGHTEREYDALPERNFDGGTWRALIDWLPTTKLGFHFETYRVPESTVDATSTHVLREGNSFGVSYAATYKLVFTARFLNEQREYQGDAADAALGLPVREDTLRVWRFGAGWEPQRHWQLGVGLDLGERTSNRLGRGYDYAQVMANARWSF